MNANQNVSAFCECGNRSFAKGMCNRCYSSWYRAQLPKKCKRKQCTRKPTGKHGLCHVHKPTENKRKARNWRNLKEGTLAHDGYIYIFREGRKVAKHRWKMEQLLERPLYPDETVHHKNGKKTDNRIKNLELWASNHPKGSRISDLLEWAHEIIERYE